MEELGNEESARVRRARSFRERPDRSGESLRRVRSFKTTSKGLVNRGDSFKTKRDLTGIANSKSETVNTTNNYEIPTLITTGSECEHRYFRVLFAGAEGVGKSSIIDQFMTSEFLGNGSFNIYSDSENSEHSYVYDILSEGHSYVTKQRPRSYSIHSSKCVTHENNVREKNYRRRRMSLPANEARIRKDRGLEMPEDHKEGHMEDPKNDDMQRNRRARSFKERSDKEGDNFRRVRSFKTTSKGIVNRGDTYKKEPETGYDKLNVPDEENTKSSNAEPGKNRSPRFTCRKGTGMLSYLRVLLVGAAGVGKTSIIDQFMTSEFLGSGSINISQSEGDRTITLQVDGEESTLEFVQSEDFQDQDESFQIDAFVVVYCITERVTFDIAIDLLKQIREEVGSNKAIILVGNKSDLVRKRTISQEEGRSAADGYGCKYIELSAALNHRVDELLVGIHKQIRLKTEADNDELESKFSKAKERKSSFKRTKRFLEKVFLGHSGKDKKTENLYVD